LIELSSFSFPLLLLVYACSTWENLTHVFFEVEEKEAIKSELGLKAVPYYAVADRHHTIVANGEPKTVNWEAELEKLRAPAAAAPAAGVGALVLDEDF
jgi:hypothetical protein